LEKINEAWKNASEEMYKAQADSAKGDSKNEKTDSGKKKDKGGDDVQDVDFEEVKD